MNVYIIVLSVVCAVTEVLKHDYWHAATWACVTLAAIYAAIDARTIRELEDDLAAMRASRDAWQDNARANTILKDRERP